MWLLQCTETPHAEERAALMATVIRRAEEHVGRRGRDRPGEGDNLVKAFRDVALRDSLRATWERVASVTRHTLDLPCLWSLSKDSEAPQAVPRWPPRTGEGAAVQPTPTDASPARAYLLRVQCVHAS